MAVDHKFRCVDLKFLQSWCCYRILHRKPMKNFHTLYFVKCCSAEQGILALLIQKIAHKSVLFVLQCCATFWFSFVQISANVIAPMKQFLNNKCVEIFEHNSRCENQVFEMSFLHREIRTAFHCWIRGIEHSFFLMFSTNF